MDEHVIPETHTFDGDPIALTEWGQDTLAHYERPVGGLAVIYDGKDASIVYSAWQDEVDPNAWAHHERPAVQTVGPISEGDTVTFDPETNFGMRPSPLKQDQLHLDGLAPRWDAAYDIPDPFDELDRVESIARHPSARAQRQTIATGGLPPTRHQGRT